MNIGLMLNTGICLYIWETTLSLVTDAGNMSDSPHTVLSGHIVMFYEEKVYIISVCCALIFFPWNNMLYF